MNRHSFWSPRLKVTAAGAVIAVLVVLLVIRVVNGDQNVLRAATSAHRSGTTAAAAPLPPRKTLDIDSLVIPCWSCPNSEASPLGFRTDLDLLAPLGLGALNAAEWYSAFTRPDGSRAKEAAAITNRQVDHPTFGKILPPDDPFLTEAQPWVEQARMHFYPDVYPLEGFQTKVPNLTLALTLARSWVARGRQAEQFDAAMADFQRTVRLGRLLRQDDATVINDLVGLAAIRLGVEAIYDRARTEGRLDLAVTAAVIAGEAPAQRLLSAARMTSAEVMPYLHRAAGHTTLSIPDDHFTEIRKIALDSPDRRFRVITCASLSLVASFGTGDQQSKAVEALRTLASSADPVISEEARWHLANPTDEKHFDELLAHTD